MSLLFSWNALRATLQLALSNDAYTHILLIVPFSAALIYMDSKDRSRKISGNAPTKAYGSGLILLAVALGIGCYAKWWMFGALPDSRLSVSMLALVIWCLGAFILCFGIRAFQSLLFPLCFLFLIVPLPESAVNWIIEFLQDHSATTARIMFRMIGIPATQDEIMLSIPNLDIEVARECSSIRSSLMLIVTTMILGHLFLRTWWRQVLLIAVAIPLSVIKNGLRIVTIAVLGTRVDPSYLNGSFHHHGGIVFFGIVVLAIGVVIWLLRQSELRATQRLN